MENKMRKNTKGKRFLALVLAAVLMLSVCPVTASAEDNLTCTKNADCEADTHFTDCPKYVAAEGCIKDDNCEAEAHVEGCPKLVTVKECTKDNNCEAETHVEGCPKLVTVKECTGDDDCEAETHTEDCPKYVAEKDTEASEPEEVSDTVKAFLDAVAAIVLPEEINEETGPVLNEQIGAAQEAYGALSEEELAREDVQAAIATMKKAMDFLTGGLQTLETTYVAKIGETEYETLDEAIKNASDGDTIELLADCDVNGLTVKDKAITIDGGKNKITFGALGIYASKSKLTFQNCELDMQQVENNPGASGGTANLISNSNLTLNNAVLNLASNKAISGIYLYQESNLYITGGSVVNITGFNGAQASGIYADNSEYDGKPNREIVISGSSAVNISNCGWHGMTINPINLTVTGSSTLSLTGNGAATYGGGLGCYYGKLTVTNGSAVIANNNKGSSWGIFVKELEVDGTSKVEACGNTGNGITVGGKGTIAAGAAVKLNDNAKSGLWVYSGSNYWYGDVTIEKGANVEILRNKDGGIYNAYKLQVDPGANVVVMNNSTDSYGGGIYNKGEAVLSESISLYNNHADKAGDDIYNVGTITFGKVGSNWALDGAPDCTDAIDGWYYDGYATDKDGIPIIFRWDAHSGKPYTVEYTDYGKAFTGKLALKAAHALNVDVPDLPVVTPDWKVSKSKTATNLDENFESKVTLSLPSAEQQLVSDVVFVLDKSTSAALENQALQMLKDLQTQIQNTSAKVNVGVVIFNNEAHVTNFMDLATQYSAIEAAIKQEISSGTNTHAGLLAGKAMLDADTSVSASRKYLIFVSDGITYMYNAVPTVTAWTFKADTVLNWAGPDNWNSKYKSNDAPESWKDYLVAVSKQVAAQGTLYEYPYGGTVTNATPVEKQSDYANSIDKALYLTYLAYQSIAQEGYHCYAVKADTGSGGQYEWGPSFMEFLAGGSTYSFETIKNDILYLVDKGSRVEDFIGYVEGDYDFDFVNDADSMELKIGDATYKAVKLGENEYGFKKVSEGYAYTVTYVKGNGKGEEHFVWYINEPITNFAPVQLTYTVKLMNPKTEAGTYGKYDADGAKRYEGLYTNTSAILYPKDSNGSDGVPESFEKPTVEYTVAAKKYNVTYQVTGTIPDGYTAPDGTTVPAGGDYTVEGVPESRKGKYNGKDGTFTFEGWTYNGTKVTELKNIQQDMLLEGVWSFKPDESVTPDPTPDYGKLTIDKSANRTTVRPGKTITYTIKVTNRTGEDLEDIVVSEKLDANLTFVSASGDGNYAVKDGLWTISELKNGKTAKLTIKATVKSGVKNGTVIKNTVVITEAGGDPVPGTPSDTVKVTVSNKISLIPETGDTSNIGLWIGVLVACAVVLGVVLILTVKKKKTR
ncbi:MAG: VWA domain-containing protein [Eubacteriales bacterium]|nr:VWA domain-containing protein [Eubacteriales bacterium]